MTNRHFRSNPKTLFRNRKWMTSSTRRRSPRRTESIRRLSKTPSSSNLVTKQHDSIMKRENRRVDELQTRQYANELALSSPSNLITELSRVIRTYHELFWVYHELFWVYHKLLWVYHKLFWVHHHYGRNSSGPALGMLSLVNAPLEDPYEAVRNW